MAAPPARRIIAFIHPAALLQDGVHARVQILHRALLALPTADHLLGHHPHFLGDAFPLQHLGRGLDPLQLIPERACIFVIGQRRMRPGAAARRQIPDQRVEALLDVRPRQEFDQLPRRRLALGAAEDHQAGATSDARAQAIRTRQRHRAPLIAQMGGLALPELADVPGTGQVEGVETVEELVPDIGDLGFRHLRRPALLEHVGVETQRTTEAGTAEISAVVVIAQQRIRHLQGQRHLLFEFVDRHQDGVAVRTGVALDRRHRPFPFVPGDRRLVEAGLAQQILAVVQQAGVHVPGHAQQLPVDHGGVPDAGKIIGLLHHLRAVDIGLQRFQRAQRGEFRQPGIAQLAQVRQAVGGERGQQFLVRGRPRDVLHVHVDAGVLAFELGHQFGDHFGLAAHRPEGHFLAAVLARAAGGQQRLLRRAARHRAGAQIGDERPRVPKIAGAPGFSALT